MRRALRTVAALLGSAVLILGPGARADDDHRGHGSQAPSAPAEGSRVGVLLVDHGEPPEYNAWTYESFREFFAHLVEMGIIPSWLTALDSGTVLVDRGCPFCDESRSDPDLMDAWLTHHDGPGVFVPESDRLPPLYMTPGGPGLGEPDIFEIVGLTAWDEWRRMGGRSPNYDEKLPKKEEVARRLRAAYGDRIAVRIGYGIDPRINGGRQGVREAVEALVNRDRVDALVVAYHGVGFSDIMQTHMLRPEVTDALESLGRVDMPLRYTEPIGTTGEHLDAVVAKVEAELAKVPAGEAVAVHLSGHGLLTTECGDYDCGADAYHESSRRLFARAKAAIEARVRWSGRLGVFRLYGEGGDEESDPENLVDSPPEALAKRKAEGFQRVVDIPYEFDSNSRDTLIILRHGYGREAPDWNSAWESTFESDGMAVKIANVNGSEVLKTDAYERVIRDQLAGWATPLGGPAQAAADGDEAVHGPAHDGSQTEGAHVLAAAHDSRPGTPGHAAGPAAYPSRSRPHAAGHVEAAAPAGHAHDDEGDGVAGLMAALFLGLLTGGALFGATQRGAPAWTRLVLVGVAATFAGLAADVVIHAGQGHPLELLENPGHWVSLAGLGLTGWAAFTQVWTGSPR